MPACSTDPAATSPFKWTHIRQQAALLVAEDRLRIPQIAAQLGIGERTIVRWKAHPEFAARVCSLVEAMAEAVKERGIASKQRRLQALDDRWRRLISLIEERGQQMAGVPGGASGLLEKRLRKIKVVVAAQDPASARRDGGAHLQGKTRRSTVEVAEYVLDLGLLRELREHERQAAEEMGQLGTNPEPSADAAYYAQVRRWLDEVAEELTHEAIGPFSSPLLPPPHDEA